MILQCLLVCSFLIPSLARSVVSLFGLGLDINWLKQCIVRGQRALSTVKKSSIQDTLVDVFFKLPKTIIQNTHLHGILSFFDATELTFEILANRIQEIVKEKYSNKTAEWITKYLKHLVILYIEGMKAITRLLLLYSNGGTIICHHKLPSVAAYTGNTSNSLFSFGGDESIESEPHTNKSFLLDDVFDIQRMNLSTRPSFPIIISEILWIIRPVVYAYCQLVFQETSWKPWFISFIMDLLSRHMTKKFNLTPQEEDEKSRRSTLLLLYLLRSPFFDRFFSSGEGVAQKLVNILNKIPLVNILLCMYTITMRKIRLTVQLASVYEFMKVFRHRHFYISGS